MTETTIETNEVQAVQGSLAALQDVVRPAGPKLPSIPKSGFARAGDKLVAIVTDDVTDSDVRQSREYVPGNPAGGAPIFDKWGRPEWTMGVKLHVLEFTETELVGKNARLFAEKRMLRAIVSTLKAQGVDAPKAGARITVHLDSYDKVEGSQYKVKEYSVTYEPDAADPSTLGTPVATLAPAPAPAAPQVPAQASAPAPAGFDPSNLSPEQYEQYLKMTGQKA